VYASVAQAFSNDVEPFALKGETLPHDQTRDKDPDLTSVQARALRSDVVPVTLSFAKRVRQLMTELPDSYVPNPSYRFELRVLRVGSSVPASVPTLGPFSLSATSPHREPFLCPRPRVAGTPLSPRPSLKLSPPSPAHSSNRRPLS
jgi:hypothetical protein